MKKILKAWTKEHQQADGNRYYTAHILMLEWFLIPWFSIEFCTDNYGSLMWTNTSLCTPKELKTRKEAEEQLINEINAIKSKNIKVKNERIVKTIKHPLSL